MQLHFLGTGTQDTRGTLSEAGFLIKTANSTIIIDPGPGAARTLAELKILSVNEIIISQPNKGHDANLIKKHGTSEIRITKKDHGTLFTLPDFTIAHIFSHIPKDIDHYKADTLILATRQDNLLEKLKPKLAILTGFEKNALDENPVYRARELQKKTGIQTIAAHDGLMVDLRSYGAVSEQKHLSKFTKA